MARMNDPWNVKCVRQAGQYVSCMKINGMPLLPPVLSKECRKEMQYYKLLAREVEKRISQLQPFLRETDSESSEDKTDAPELPECEQNFEVPYEEEKTDFNSKHLKKSVDPLSRHTTSSRQARPLARNARCLTTDVSKNITSNVVVGSKESCSRSNSPKLIIDLSVNINESGKNVFNVIKRARSPAQIDLPERDYNCTTRITQKVTTEEKVTTETKRHRKHKDTDEESTNFSFKLNKNNLEESITDNLSVSQDGHTTLSSKSFTGSLNDLHRDSVKDLQHTLPLVRQRSYTLLNPSPQLLAHLEVQSLNTGIEMSSISMSESLSNISCSKKRRSWDLESAKVKWSSMALELNQTGTKRLKRNASNKCFMKQQPKNSSPTIHSTRAKSVAPEKTRPSICFGSAITPKPMPRSNQVPNSDSPPKSEPKPRKYSPVRNTNNRSLAKDPGSPKSIKKLDLSTQSHAPSSILNSENPAAHVRELYEKIQQQQLLQMQTLVEKQKKEQMLLQQVFEEQNSLLFKQLKSICPTSPIEVKEAWGDKHPEQGQAGDRGPVSLSQLINYKSPDQSSVGSPVSTLTNTNNYINVCDNVLKKSRDITGSIKKQPIKTHTQNGTKNMPPRTQTDGYRTRTQSPKSPVSPNSPKSSRSPQRNTATSRRLTYETSVSTDHDYEPLLTDRTNDTMADLNVTFPSDNDDDFGSQVNNSVVSHIFGKEIKTIHATAAMHNSSAAENAIRHMEKTIHANTAVHNSSAAENAIRSMEETIHATTTIHNSSAENAIRHMEQTIYESMNSINSLVSKAICKSVTPREQAAATKIVAWAKGYLVRRLMRTDRVQATVQTIKDALLCALQLHQDREGIRGADVDLHRRLIQQITAACYSLHDTFVASTAAERCAMIAADRERRRSLAARQANGSMKQTNLMSQSHTGAFPARTKRPSTSSLMTQSNYETFSEGKRAGVSVSRHMASPHRRPWR